ncbi:MAG: SCO family protein [Gammaproteobacteria bacterium]|nr:SCO family protein [Gammaproteobacteria bacterium]
MTANSSFFKNNRTFIAFAVSAIIGFFLWRVYDVQIKDPIDRIMLDQPQSITPFSLIGSNNKPFTNEQLKGKWTFLFFGYTSCPDVCPTTLTEMATLSELLSHSNDLNQIQFIFISVDPDRDTPDHLKNFIAYFNESFVAATGTIEQLNTLTDQLSVQHRRLKEQGDEYLVEHSAELLLFSPESTLLARFSAPHHADKISKLFSQLIKGYTVTK